MHSKKMKNLIENDTCKISRQEILQLKTMIWNYPPEVLERKVRMVLRREGYPVSLTGNIEPSPPDSDLSIRSFLIENKLKISPVYVMIINRAPYPTGYAELRLFEDCLKKSNAGTALLLSTTEFTRYVRDHNNIEVWDGEKLVRKMKKYKIAFNPLF